MSFFEKKFKSNLSFEQGINLLVQALELGLDEKEKMDYSRLEFAFINDKKEFTKLTSSELKSFIK